MRRFALLLILASLGCRTDPKPEDSGEPTDSTPACIDADADGFCDAEDCDDSDAAIHPDATETCDELDNDCDGEIDEDDAADAATWYADEDSDGYGDAEASVTTCDLPDGHVSDDTDCDDADATIHPAADELCNEIDDD